MPLLPPGGAAAANTGRFCSKNAKELNRQDAENAEKGKRNKQGGNLLTKVASTNYRTSELVCREEFRMKMV